MMVTHTSSPQRKLQAWLESKLLAGGLTDPILQEDTGEEAIAGRHLLVSVDPPETHTDFPAGLQWAPLQSVVVIALIQPAVNKILNTPAAIAAFDKAGRNIDDIFLGPATKLSGPHIHVSWVAHQMSGHDPATVDTNGRRLRFYVTRYLITFSEKPDPEPVLVGL